MRRSLHVTLAAAAWLACSCGSVVPDEPDDGGEAADRTEDAPPVDGDGNSEDADIPFESGLETDAESGVEDAVVESGVEDATAESDACVPDCRGRECGLDLICRTLDCGTCGRGESCMAEGYCLAEVGPDWIVVPAGTFRMGSPLTEPGREPNETPHTVVLTRRFALLSTEVTQRQFEFATGYRPGPDRDCTATIPECPACDNCPVVRVNWHEAAAFCNRLSRMAGRTECYECVGTDAAQTCSPNPTFDTPYDCPGYRLPTEAEWEYAARAGDERATYNGDLGEGQLACEHPNPVLDPIAWFCGNSDWRCTEVGSLAGNTWSLRDMLGGAWEWCHDWWTDVYSSSISTDPWGPMTGTGRVIRGGSFDHPAREARAAFRFSASPEYRCDNMGFRPVRTLP